jgi:hypothetical protein
MPTAFSYPSYDQALSDFLISVERLRLISASPPESFNPWICRVIAQLPQRITPRNLEPHEVLSILKNLGLHKYTIYEIIKNLKDPELKLKTLDAILTRAPQDPDSLGAQLFWKKRKFTHKSTEKGTLQKLKEMHDELKAQLKTQAVSAFSFHQSPVHDVRPTVAVIPQGAGAPAGGAGIGAGMGALSVV